MIKKNLIVILIVLIIVPVLLGISSRMDIIKDAGGIREVSTVVKVLGVKIAEETVVYEKVNSASGAWAGRQISKIKKGAYFLMPAAKHGREAAAGVLLIGLCFLMLRARHERNGKFKRREKKWKRVNL